MNSRLSHRLLVLSLLFGWQAAAEAQGLFNFERKPIDYHNQVAKNPVSQLQEKILSGKVQLEYQGPRGYLDSFLKQLNVSQTTQALVFSKSSLQLHRIAPPRPRAIYFNDNVYVGWVQGGDVLEIIASDPSLGTVFYTLRQQDVPFPRFTRDRGQCLQCHANRRTKQVPGPVVRSLFTQINGQPVFNLGSFVSDHTSPFSRRWGGYYVTGTHGTMLHMGNMVVDRNTPLEEFDYQPGANVTDLSSLVNTRPYLTRHSDIVALMVLEHQSQMQNLITQAHFEEIRGKYYDSALSREEGFQSDFTKRRIFRASEELLKYMLFFDEHPLSSPVKGTSGFTEEFSARGPHDKLGHSLYQLDLQTRMFKYPMSYMIYTEAFKQLPPLTLAHLSRRLQEVLTAESTDDEFSHLDLETRKVILKIARETYPLLTKNW